MMMYAAMMAGRLAPAREAADEMCGLLTPELLGTRKPHMAVTLEGYCSTRMHVLVRFGRWQEILEAPPPSDRSSIASRPPCATTRAGWRTQRSETWGRPKRRACRVCDGDGARSRRAPLLQQPGAGHPHGRGSHAGRELAYRRGDVDAAFDHLREAARRNDDLYYTEPWSWMHPPRHALGALLLEQDRIEEAMAVYRADLGYDDTLDRCARHPDNVWALHGYAECLHRLGETRKPPSRRNAPARRLRTPIRPSRLHASVEGGMAGTFQGQGMLPKGKNRRRDPRPATPDHPNAAQKAKSPRRSIARPRLRPRPDAEQCGGQAPLRR